MKRWKYHPQVILEKIQRVQMGSLKHHVLTTPKGIFRSAVNLHYPYKTYFYYKLVVFTLFRKKLDPSATSHHGSINTSNQPSKNPPVAKKKKPVVKTSRHNNVAPVSHYSTDTFYE